jgi:hypothetical protein
MDGSFFAGSMRGGQIARPMRRKVNLDGRAAAG